MTLAGLEAKQPTISSQCRAATVAAHTGRRSFRWKGGRIKDAKGYVMIWLPDHPNATMKGYIFEHRLVMAEALGRPLERFESVHHVNGVKDDNRWGNLLLVTEAQHHGSVECPHCGKEFAIR